MTWLFVTTMPFSSIINPDPKAEDCLSCGTPNSLNISSKGEPGGNWKGNGLDCVVIVVVVEIFTTDGISFSARSANELGTPLEKDFVWKLKTNKVDIKNIFNLFILTLNVINNDKTNYRKY